LHDLLVLQLVVLDRLGTIRHMLFDRRINVHFLSDGVAHHLCDDGIGQVPAPGCL
jgi:hypothetical protein